MTVTVNILFNKSLYPLTNTQIIQPLLAKARIPVHKPRSDSNKTSFQVRIKYHNKFHTTRAVKEGRANSRERDEEAEGEKKMGRGAGKGIEINL